MTKHFEDLIAAISWFKNVNGHTDVPGMYVMPSGAKLGLAVQVLRKEKKEGKLTNEEIKRLEEIGFKWENPTERRKDIEKGVEMYLREKNIE